MKMKNKKIIIAAGILMMIFGVNIVFGEVISSSYSEQAEKFYQKYCTKSKLKGINAFVCDLRQRVDNIPESPNLLVLDSLNNEVGIYLGSINDYVHEAWNRDTKKILSVNLMDNVIDYNSESAIFFYESLDCVEPALMPLQPYRVHKIISSNKYGWSYVVAKESALFRRNVPTKSYWNHNTGCVNEPAPVQRDLIEVEPIIPPIFNPPFSIVEQ